MTIPTFQLPELRFEGNKLQNAKVTPDRSLSSSLPLAIWNTATRGREPIPNLRAVQEADKRFFVSNELPFARPGHPTRGGAAS
jgi:hypothetical protein